MTRLPLLGLTAAFMLLALAAAVSCGDAEDEPAHDSTAPTHESATTTPEPQKPTNAAPLSLPAELPPPSEGYRWWEIQAAEQFGFPGYAVQVPLDWVSGGPGNPSLYESANATEAGPRLSAYVMPVGTVYSHPLLNLLPMQGTTCRDGIPRLETPSPEQITGNYT